MNQEEILREELGILREDIIQRMRENGQYVSGETAAGLELGTEPGHGWLSGFSYMDTLQHGRRPGKAPMYFEEIILRWIQAKGLQPRSGETVERMARAIAWSIRKHGNLMHRNGYEVDLFSQPIKEFNNRLANRLGVLWASEITKVI